MCKILDISRLVVIFLTVTTVCFSCDGRDKKLKNHVQSFKENNTLKSTEKHVNTVPKSHIEIATDTILNHDYHVKIVYRSMNNDAVITLDNTNSTETKHKNFEAQLHVLKNGISINQTIINKSLFETFENQSYWDMAIMQYVWIDYEASTKHKLVFNTAFYNLETNKYRDYVLNVDASGILEIKQKKYAPNTI